MLAAAAALAIGLAAQGEVAFTHGLAIQQVAVRTFEQHSDPVLEAMVREGWKTPRVGDVVTVGDEKRAWQTIEADKEGAFPQRLFSRGWAYFEIERPKSEIMLLEASGTWDVYAVGEHRAGDSYGYGWLRLPVKLRSGRNSFMFAPGRAPLKARLLPLSKPLFFNLDDATLPDIVEGESGEKWAGLIVVNATEKWTRGLRVRARVFDGPTVESRVPSIPPLTYRKVVVRLSAPKGLAPGAAPLALSLLGPGGEIERRSISLRVRTPLQTRKVTFVSEVDGSVQYYAVHPAQTPGDGKALVLAMHGARTEALEMADDYKGKDWCHIVCPTNRRPFGFDWEDIGRLDAIEVLAHAKKSLKTDALLTTLTGHSMGGHGAWINGVLFPDKWAAVAPCAAWISIFGYGNSKRADPKTEAGRVMDRAANASDTLLLLNNALNYPIYMHHGDKDEDVPFSESQTMKAELEKIGHKDVTLNVVEGGGHWIGTESIDWPGLFQFLKGKRLTPNAEKSDVDFTTVSLATSARAWWAQIVQQERWMAPSRIRLHRGTRLEGTTENVAALRLDAEAFLPNVKDVALDGQPLRVDGPGTVTLRKTDGKWSILRDALRAEKNPDQIGPFREVLKNRFVFVVGTTGTVDEDDANLNLARYHAEVFAYGGNGNVDILTDRDFERRRERRASNVVLFGNADTNSAWKPLLADSPIQVRRGAVAIGAEQFAQEDLCAVAVRPRHGDRRALVAFVASTGPSGQRALERLPLFTPGAHYPDWAVFTADYFTQGLDAVKAAGFFDASWRLTKDAP